MPRKPAGSGAGKEGRAGEYQPIKIRSDIYRILKTVASWKGISIQDYLDELIKRELGPDLLRMASELTELVNRNKSGEEG
jgi:hypothetical protein